jgi:hypothetical protein
MEKNNIYLSEIKLTYSPPEIKLVMLDNEISLILQSAVPDPSEPGASLIAPEHFNNDPFKINLG